MKKKIVSMFLVTALLSTAYIGIYPKVATADEVIMVKIGVDEQLDDINILTVTEYSDTLDWIYKMTYDTLITLDEDGNFAPGLAEEWQVVVLDEGGGENSFDPTLLEFEDWPAEWTTSYPPGWETLQDFGYSEDGRGSLEFCVGDSSIGIYIKLRRGVELSRGEELTSETIQDMLDTAYYISSDTLFYQQWEPFAYPLDGEEGATFSSGGIEIIGDYEFMLYPKLGVDGKGWIDILYGLTEPMAGIIEVNALNDDSQYIEGMGAYKIEDFNIVEGYVHLTPNFDWILGAVPAQDVRFIFMSNDEARWGAFTSNEVDIVVTPHNAYEDNMANIQTNAVEGNPFYLIINKENTPILEDVAVRKTLAQTILNESSEMEEEDYVDGIRNQYADNTINPIFSNTLSYSANGLWSKDMWKYSSDLNEILLDLFRENPPQLTFGYLASMEYTYMVDEIQNAFAYYNVVLSRYAIQDESEYLSTVDMLGWDFAIKEIEMSNLNSAYHELYGKISDDTDYMLRGTMYAANLYTYAYLHAHVQIKLHNDASYINLGWQKKIISNKSGVSGITFPTGGFSPTGDVSRIDFRGVTKI